MMDSFFMLYCFKIKNPGKYTGIEDKSIFLFTYLAAAKRSPAFFQFTTFQKAAK